MHASPSSTAAPLPTRSLQGWGTQRSQQGARFLTVMEREERHTEKIPEGGAGSMRQGPRLSGPSLEPQGPDRCLADAQPNTCSVSEQRGGL